MRYLKGWFIIDLLATFPSDYIVKAVQVCSFSLEECRLKGSDSPRGDLALPSLISI